MKIKRKKIMSWLTIITVLIGVYSLITVGAAADNNDRSTNQELTLSKACSLGDLTAVKKIIAAKPKFNGVDSEGNTALHQACLGNHPEIAALLIANGVNINAKNNWGEAPLFNACTNGFNELVKLLLAKGANLNQKDRFGRTAFWGAVSQGRSSTVALLINRGANLFGKDGSGKTVLFAAVESGNQELVGLLIAKRIAVACPDNEGNTPLHAACAGGKSEIAELLIAKGADVNARNKAGETPLFLTCKQEQEQTEVAAMLIEKGAQINTKDWAGNTPLTTACKYQKQAIARLLLAKGADCRQSDPDGGTPLQYAAEYGWTETLKLLAARGMAIPNKSEVVKPVGITRVGCMIANVQTFIPPDADGRDRDCLYYYFYIYIDNLNENLSRIKNVTVYNKYNHSWTFDLKKDVNIKEGYIGKRYPVGEYLTCENKSLILLDGFRVEVTDNDGRKSIEPFNLLEPGSFADTDAHYLYGESYRGRITPAAKPALKIGKITSIRATKTGWDINFTIDDQRVFDGCIWFFDRDRKMLGRTECFRKLQNGKVVAALNDGRDLWVNNRPNVFRVDLAQVKLTEGRSKTDIRYAYLFLSDGKQYQAIGKCGEYAYSSHSKLYELSLK